MADYRKVDQYLQDNLDKSIDELSTLVAQPSVGAQNLGVKECAALVATMLRNRGFDVEIMDTPGRLWFLESTRASQTKRC